MSKAVNLIHGIGFNDKSCPSWKEGKSTREYTLWVNMLYRCTEKSWIKIRAYKGAVCSENFRHYSYFYKWCQQQEGFQKKDENNKFWQLDKDFFDSSGKVYSEATCIFIPARINTLLLRSNSVRGEYPVGVHFDSQHNKLRAMCSIGGKKQKHLGLFLSVGEAFQAYKTFKEALIKQVANEYKEQLDSRVYEALMNYEVNEND